MKITLLFALIALSLCAPTYGMLEPLGSDYQALLDQAADFAENRQFDRAHRNLAWIVTHDEDPARRALCNYCIGLSYNIKKNLEKAKSHFKCSAQQTHNLEIRAEALLELAEIARIQKKYAKAKRYYLQAVVQNDNQKVKMKAHCCLMEEKEIKRDAKTVLSLKRDALHESRDAHETDDSTEATNKRHKPKAGLKMLANAATMSLSSKLAYRSLLAKMAHNEKEN